LQADHEKVKGLFDEFEKANDWASKITIVGEALEELSIHATLIAELEEMDGTESHYDAKFTVLAENVRHHIKEEEESMLPEAQKTELDFDALGEDMRALEEELRSEGVPTTGEADMVAKSEGHGDSPAEAARAAH
jgi:hypothetical protein